MQEEFDGIVRFWLDRGVDGIRVDAAPAMAKVPGLPDAGHSPGATSASSEWVGNPHWDVDEVHEVFRRRRRIGDTYDGDRRLPQQASWRSLTAEAQHADGSSTLSLYRAALRLRRERVTEEPLSWLDLGDGVLAFDRGSALRCVVDLAARPLPLPRLGRVLLTGGQGGGELAPDAAAWLATDQAVP